MALLHGSRSDDDTVYAAAAVKAEKEKEGSMRTKILAAAMLLLAVVGAFSGHRYYMTAYLPGKRLDEAVKKQAEIIERIRHDTLAKAADTGKAPDNPLVLCENVNDDIVGWITIPDTNIDLPVVQGEDNDFYLHNGVDGQYNYELGCPFLDYRCESDFSGFNSIVYAHNMTEQRMFADIALYKDEAFFQSHPAGTLTMKDGEHDVQFFAYMTTMSTSPAYHVAFASLSEKEDYIEYVFSEANYTDFFTPDELKGKEDLHFLLLSTCTFESDDARGILFGVIG